MDLSNTQRKAKDSTNGKQNNTRVQQQEEYDVEAAKIVKANPAYTNTLSARQMDSLTALFDTFLPSIDNIDCHGDESLLQFYQTSASMARTPQHLGGLLSERLEHPRLWLAKLSLFMLSTWIGTFIMCGMTGHFPLFHNFSQISNHKREKIVRAWSRSWFFPNKLLFTAFKILCLLAFFTQVNEQQKNACWDAIGYYGPDPDFKRKIKTNQPSTLMQLLEESNEHDSKTEHPNNQVELNMEDQFGPLNRGILNLNLPRKVVIERLKSVGFSVSVPHSKKNRSKSLDPSFVIKCDVVVVGSGSGGGVAAGILANAGYKVLVLEKGDYFARENLSLLEGSAMDKMYLGSGLLATKNMDVVLLAGSTVGGGSTINWSASIRTPQHVIKEWSQKYEIELFDSKLYEEALDAVCKKMGVQSEIEDEGFNNMVLRKGCQELGYPVTTIPRNAPADHYCGWCCLGCKDGKKKGTAETWLKDLVDSGNGVILPNCDAIKVVHEWKKKRDRRNAAGVAFRFQNENGTEEVGIVKSKVVIVACGALSTPQLLKRSGLSNPHIGKNLHIHPVAMAWGYFPDDSSDYVWPEPKKKSYEGGIMTAMSTVVANFKGSGYGAILQTPALHPGMYSALMPWLSGMDFKTRMLRFSRTAHLFALARDKGSGQVLSPHSVSYKMDKIDEENLKKGLEKVLRILAASGAEEIGTHNVAGKVLKVKEVSSNEFEKFVKEESNRPLSDLSTLICSAHQMGSCRMGIEPSSSAVNSMGETWEVEGLYIADSSVFPTALGVNPMVTVQATAYCTAQSVLEFLKRKSMNKGKG